MLRALGVLALTVVAIPFAVLEAAFRLLPVSSPPPLQAVSARDPVVRFEPNVEYTYSQHWDFSIVTRKRTNNAGYNHFWDYDARARSPLLMVIGDSFVEAQTVDAKKSVAELLHAGMGGEGRVYSIGVSGAPLSQYLVFAEHARDVFRAQAMAFVIIGNDFDESLLAYKSEPRFHYFDRRGALRRVDYELSAAKAWLRHSAFLRYVVYNASAGHRIQALLASPERETPAKLERRIADSRRAVDYFLDQLPARAGLGTQAILFVLDGVRPALYTEATWREARQGYHERMRVYFAAQARARGYEVLDMQPVFLERHRRDGSRFEFATDSHWNELGNRVVAGEMRKSAVFARLFGGGRAVAAGLRTGR